MKLNLDEMSALIIECAIKDKHFRLPPSLKVEGNLKKFLKFFFEYYGDKKNITLKNADNYCDFTSITSSKMHLWVQTIAYGLRIAMIEHLKLSNDSLLDYILSFYKTYMPNCPIVLKSALDKYKFIVINNWTDAQLKYCTEKETQYFKENKEFPSFVSEQFEEYSVKNEILDNLKQLIQVSETLDDEGHFDLSEKILKSTENLANKIGINNGNKKFN